MNLLKRNSGRAFEPGPRRALSMLPIAVVLALALPLSGCGGRGGPSLHSANHGLTRTSFPKFLPEKTIDPRVDATLVGTTTKPALQVEGLPVEVKTSSFSVLVTVSGPVVPGEGLPAQSAATTCTWTVTMKHASGDVPVSISDFHSVDHLGAVYRLGLVPGEHAPRSVLRPGHALSFQLRAYELVGEGMMQWAPDHEHVVAYWDYTVEND